MLNFFKRKRKEKPPQEKQVFPQYDTPTVLLTEQPDALPIETEQEPEILDGIVVNTASATHIGTRQYQQDSCFVCQPTQAGQDAYGVLCDGMGGMHGGERASADVVEFFKEFFSHVDEMTDIPTMLEAAVHDANDMMLANHHAPGQEAGTTLVCCYIRGSSLYWVSVGDSRIYVIRNHEIVRLTKDHNYALQLQQMVAEGKLTQQQADSNPRKEALISYLGAPTLELVDISHAPLQLQTDDTILLCSDGLTKCLSDEQIHTILSQDGRLKDMVHRVVVTAIDDTSVGHDNTTAILMRYIGAEPNVSIDINNN